MNRLLVISVLSMAALFPALAFAKDTTPPAAVTDLQVGVGVTTAVPVWTNTGDDGTVGTADSYEVRYSTSPITESNWRHCPVFCSGTPFPSGTPQCCNGDSVNPGTTYYFAIRLKDEAHNQSPLSNVVQVTTHTSGAEVAC